MALFGPTGKPITAKDVAGGVLVGGPKGLDDLQLLDDATIETMASGMNTLVGQGQPLEVPAALPLGQLAQIAKTMKHYRDLCSELESRVAELESVSR